MSKIFRVRALAKRKVGKIRPQVSDAIKKKSLRVKGDPLSVGKSETQIQEEICVYLDSCAICYWVFDIKGKPIMTPYGLKLIPDENRGFSDLLVCYKGLFISLEVKSCMGVASEDQLDTQIKARRGGGIYEFVTSVREVQAVFAKLSA